jgi:hypothetical protein
MIIEICEAIRRSVGGGLNTQDECWQRIHAHEEEDAVTLLGILL